MHTYLIEMPKGPSCHSELERVGLAHCSRSPGLYAYRQSQPIAWSPDQEKAPPPVQVQDSPVGRCARELFVLHCGQEWEISQRKGKRIERAEARCKGCAAVYPVLEGVGVYLFRNCNTLFPNSDAAATLW